MYTFYETNEQYVKRTIAKGKDFMLNSEYYGYSIKMNGKIYKYNYNFKRL